MNFGQGKCNLSGSLISLKARYPLAILSAIPGIECPYSPSNFIMLFDDLSLYVS